MAKARTKPIELDERLSLLGRAWFAEARERSAADDREVDSYRRRHNADDRAGWGDLLADLSGGDDSDTPGDE